MIACLLLFAGLSAAAQDFCVCDGCERFSHREAVGTCTACKARFGTIDDRLCDPCASKGPSCGHCGKRFRNPKLLVGEAFLVDKQPRADLTYHVAKGEDGTSQGLYFDPKQAAPLKGRALFFAAENAQGALVVRTQFPLDPKEKDVEVKGESEGPVSWRFGHLAGPVTAPKDGKFSIVLPAVPDAVFEVVSGEKVLARHRYTDGAWKQVK